MIPMNDLSNELLPEGKLTVLCEITISTAPRSTKEPQTAALDRQKNGTGPKVNTVTSRRGQIQKTISVHSVAGS